MDGPWERGPARRERAFNIPAVMLAAIAALVLIHGARMVLLSPEQDLWLLANFAYFPLRPEGELPLGELLPGAEVWSFLSYAFLHADWGHLLLNVFWMAAFGSPLAWRFGPTRFLAFSATAIVAGAVAHLLSYGGEVVPMIGASAAVSAHMAGAARFLFIAPRGFPRSYWSPAVPLSVMVRDGRTMAFLGIWLAFNLGFGLMGWDGAAIAWQAHLGGFVVGLLLFRLFDPVPSAAGDYDPPPSRDAA